MGETTYVSNQMEAEDKIGCLIYQSLGMEQSSGMLWPNLPPAGRIPYRLAARAVLDEILGEGWDAKP